MPSLHIDLGPATYSIALFAAFCVGLSKTGFSGTSLVSVLLFAELFGALPSVGIALPLLIFSDICVYPLFRKYASWKQVWPLLPPAVAGVFLGAYLMSGIDNAVAKPVIGTIIAIMLGLHLVRKYFGNLAGHLPHSLTFAWVCGTFGGVATTMANAAGPVMSIYLLLRRFPKNELLGITARFFLFINLFKIPFNVGLDIITPRTLLIDLLLVPGVLAGIFFGKRLVDRVPQKLFDTLILVFATVAAVRLIFF